MSIAHIWFSLLQNQHDGGNKAHYFSVATYRTDVNVSPNQMIFCYLFKLSLYKFPKSTLLENQNLYMATQQKMVKLDPLVI